MDDLAAELKIADADRSDTYLKAELRFLFEGGDPTQSGSKTLYSIMRREILQKKELFNRV